MNPTPAKWLIEVTDQQLSLIIDCVEDCHRFAAGQTELWHTTGAIGDPSSDTDLALREKLDKLQPLVAPDLGPGSSYSWSGSACSVPTQRKFIAQTYGLYRHLRHLRTVHEGKSNPMNVYNSETLTCEDQGELPDLTPMTKLDYKGRLLRETASLKGRISALYRFMTSAQFAKLDDHYQTLLKDQLEAMRTYYDILKQRIEIERSV